MIPVHCGTSDGGHAYRRVTSSAKLFFPVKRQRHREMINDSVHEMLDFFSHCDPYQYIL